MKCPICNANICEDANVCRVCNFSGLQHEFINVEEVDEWKNFTLPYYRTIWGIKNKTSNITNNLYSEEAKRVFRKYCTEKDHVYRFKNLTINTKYAAFIWDEVIDGERRRHIKKFGYEFFEIGYKVDGDAIFLYMKDKENPNKRYGIATITASLSKRQELLMVFDFMRSGELRFDHIFDDNAEWFEYSDTERNYMMTNYFCGATIRPLRFSAKYTDYDEYYNEKSCISIEGDFEIVVKNKSNKIWSVKDQKLNEPKIIHIKRCDNENCEVITIDLSKTKENVHLDEKTMSVFIGQTDNYQRFVFDDVITAQRVFDYFVILFHIL